MTGQTPPLWRVLIIYALWLNQGAGMKRTTVNMVGAVVVALGTLTSGGSAQQTIDFRPSEP